MSNRLFRRAASALLALLLASAPAQAQEDNFAAVQIKTQQVAEGIYMLTGEGGNIGVSVGADGVFMIDDQFAPLSEKIKAAVAALSDQPIRFLINTHWHYDHTGGNELFAADGVIIVAHHNVRKRMAVDTEIAAFGSLIPASPKAALPVLTFNDNLTLHLNGDEARVIHYKNSHTDGDSLIHFVNANVIHTGDLWFNGVYPFVDISSGGTVSGALKTVKSILALVDDNTRIIPGHGPLGDKQALRDYLAMLETVSGRMAKLIAAGKSIDEIVALKPNADYDEAWGKDLLKPDMFLRILYDLQRAESP